MVRLTAWVVAVTSAAVWLWSDVGWSTVPEEQAMTVVRVVAASLATWLLVATALAVAGRVLRVRWLGAVAPAGIRRLVATALAGAVLLSPAAASAGGAGGAPPPGVEVPVLERVDEPAPAVLRAPEPVESAPVRGEPEDVHLVEPGDHLWSIARAELAARAGGREPSDAEIVPYWRRLIDANRHVVGGDPDLIRPGDRIDLPS